ncbi:MAG: hypothetical protein R3B47_17275 [Bacteroidia bacterium]
MRSSDGQYDQALLIQNTDAADTLILKIIRQKQGALDAILEARRARARAKRTREEAGSEMGDLRATIDSSRSRQQEAVVNRAFLEDWISEGEAIYNNARNAKEKAAIASRRANQEVNSAFRTVAQSTLAHRRHNTTYLGLNYNFFRAYQSTSGLNPLKGTSETACLAWSLLGFLFTTGLAFLCRVTANSQIRFPMNKCVVPSQKPGLPSLSAMNSTNKPLFRTASTRLWGTEQC